MAVITLPIPASRRISLAEAVNQKSISRIIKEIEDINNDDSHLIKLYDVYGLSYTPQPIELVIDTYGGEVYTALGLISVMKASPTPIHTIVTGCAMSAGFIIAISGHKRFAYKLSSFMYHQLSGVKWGMLQDLEEDVKQSKLLQKELEKIVLTNTKIISSQLKENRERKQDWYMTADEALKVYGVIDEII